MCCFCVGPQLHVRHTKTGKKDSLNHRLRLFERGQLKLSIEGQIDLYNALANEYKFRNPDSILYYVKKALALNEFRIYPKGYLVSTIRYGDYFGDIGEISQATEKYQKALSLTEEVDDSLIEVDLLQGIALHSFFNERNEDWYAYLQKAIELASQNNYLERWAVLRHIEGFLLYNYKLYSESAQAQKFADSLFQILDIPEMRICTQTNLAQNSLDWGQIEAFKKHADSSLSLLSQHPDYLWQVRIYHVLSKFHLNKKEHSRSLYWNNQAFNLLNRITLPREKLENHRLRAGIYLGLNRPDSALIYARSSLALSEQTNDSVSLCDGYLYLSQIAESRGEKDSTLFYLLKHAELQNLVNVSNKSKKLNLIRNQFDFKSEKIRQEQRLKLQSKAQNFTLIIVALFIVLGSVVTSQLWQGKKRQESLRKRLMQLANSKDRIFSMVSYDLVSPLLTLELLLAKYDSKKIDQKELMATLPALKDRVELSSFTLNNLLYWAQSQLPESKPNPKEIAIKERAAMICELLKDKIKAKKIRLECQIPKNLAIWMDINHLDIVLKNVIYNAIKFSPENGSLVFKAKERNEFVCIEIFNQGNSICPLLVEAIKEGEDYPSLPGTREETGSGFGLKVTKELLHKNNGKLEILPLPNRGTQVKIHIPKKEPKPVMN